MKTYRYYMFDFDGTVADSQGFWQVVNLEVLRSRGILVKDRDYEVLRTLAYEDRWTYCRDRFGLSEEERPTIEEIRAEVDRFYRTEVTWKRGAEEYLRELKAENKITVLFSATPKRMILHALERLGGADLFDCVFSASDIGISKGDPESYRYCLREMGCEGFDGVMYEDALYSMKSAKQVGLDVVAVYEPCMQRLRPEIEQVCDRFVMSFDACRRGAESKPFSVAIFDFDGTLADSQWCWQTMLLRKLRQRGIAVEDEDVELCLDRDWLSRHEELLRKYGVSEPLFSDYHELHSEMERFYREEVFWKPGAREYLEYLKKKGVKPVLYSTTPERLLRCALDRLQGQDLFDVIFSGEDRGWSKGDPESFRLCMAELGVTPEECVLFEDSLYSIRSAKEAGMRVFAVRERCFQQNRDTIRRLADRYGDSLMDFAE